MSATNSSSKKHRTGIAALLISVALLTNGCSLFQSARSRTDRAVSLMNHGNYSAAVSLLEQEHGNHPDDHHVTVLLAQAHLGSAKLEMLELADHVMSGQARSGAIELKARPDCPAGPIKDVHDSDAGCILLRILTELPAADDPHVLRARDLLRAAYPDPVHTSTDINFLAAFVEFSSALARTRAFIIKGQIQGPQDIQISAFIHQSKGLLDELQQGLKRARYSYGKVSRFVANLDGKPLIEIGGQKLVFNEDIGVPALLRFMAAVLHESADQIDSQLNTASAGALGNLGSGFVSVLQSLDLANFGGETGQMLVSTLHFESAIGAALSSVADGVEKDEHFDVFSQAWKDPPRIFREPLPSAFRRLEVRNPRAASPISGSDANRMGRARCASFGVG